MRIRIGTRGSRLGLWQANWVGERLRAAHSDVAVEIVAIKTHGDDIPPVPTFAKGDRDLFTREIEQALAAGEIDLAVHSAKDLPTQLPEGLKIASICERERVEDVLISRGGVGLAKLPDGTSVGTSSLRRRSQLLHFYPHLAVKPIRGNVDTRLAKLDAGEFDALVLAYAGIRRLNLTERVTKVLSPDWMLPAPGQGALAIEVCADYVEIRQYVVCVDHEATRCAVEAERSFLRSMGGGCNAPVGALGRIADGNLLLDGMIADPDGGRLIRDCEMARPSDATAAGERLAKRLLARGGDAILRDIALGEDG